MEPTLLDLLNHAAEAADNYVGKRCVTGEWYRAAAARLREEMEHANKAPGLGKCVLERVNGGPLKHPRTG